MTNRSALALRNTGAVSTLLGASDSLQNLNTQLLDDGCWCYVADQHAHYELRRDSVAPSNPPLVIVPNGGPGRWFAVTGGSAQALAPLKATYYVDPAFTGVQTGSIANPFTTVAACFAAALASGFANGVIFIAPNSTITENITFPIAGGDWEIASQQTWGYFNVILTGSIDIGGTGRSLRALTNLQTTGPIIGNTPAGLFSRVRFYGTILNGSVNLTAAVGGGWRAFFVGSMPMGVSGSGGASVAVNVAGLISASFWRFLVAPIFSVASEFFTCLFDGGVGGGLTSDAPGAITAVMLGCSTNSGGLTFTATSGSLRVFMDQFTAESFGGGGLTVSGAVAQIVGDSNRLTLTGNLGTTQITNVYPTSKMIVTYTLTILTPGTSGSAQVNVSYTDLVGTPHTVAVGSPLLVTSVAGTEISGSIMFSQNGSAPVQISVTGVVTPGPLSMSLAYDEQISA